MMLSIDEREISKLQINSLQHTNALGGTHFIHTLDVLYAYSVQQRITSMDQVFI